MSLSAAIEVMQEARAGEIIIISIDDDGSMNGYNLEFARKTRSLIIVPMTLLGGAGKAEDFSKLFGACGTLGATADSYIVFNGVYCAVLINYPDPAQKETIIAAAKGQ